MAILFTCNCGQRLKAPDDMAGRRAKCFQCGAAVRVPVPFLGPVHSPPPQPTPDLGIDLDEDREVPEAPEPPLRRPFWKDPVVMVGGAVPLAILLAFFGHLYRGWSHERFKQRIAVMKAEADSLARAGKTVQAYLAYTQLLRYAGEDDPGDGQTRADLAMARKAQRQLEPEAEAIVAKETEKARLAAEERRRYEEQSAERDRLSQIRADVEGTIWVEMKIGTVRPLGGLTVYLLDSSIRAGKITSVWMQLKERLEYRAGLIRGVNFAAKDQAGTNALQNEILFRDLARRAGELASFASSDVVDVKAIHKLLREIGVGAPREKVIGDDLWPAVLNQATMAQTETTIDGKYKIEGLAGGEYYMYAVWYNEQALIEWMFPLRIDKPKVVCDLHNNKATLILNKTDDR